MLFCGLGFLLEQSISMINGFQWPIGIRLFTPFMCRTDQDISEVLQQVAYICTVYISDTKPE